eukprot:4628752-Amphidinium_carterae.2
MPHGPEVGMSSQVPKYSFHLVDLNAANVEADGWCYPVWRHSSLSEGAFQLLQYSGFTSIVHTQNDHAPFLLLQQPSNQTRKQTKHECHEGYARGMLVELNGYGLYHDRNERNVVRIVPTSNQHPN